MSAATCRSDATRSRLVGDTTVCLSAPLNKLLPLRYPDRQKDKQEGRKKEAWPCLTSSPPLLLCMQSAAAATVAECLSRSPVECLCNWTLRWSSSNHGRIIKTCWSLQSWERGRFINDTLTTACGPRALLRDGNIAWNRWLDCHLPAGPPSPVPAWVVFHVNEFV